MSVARGKEFDFHRVSDRVTALGGPYAFVYWVVGEQALLIDAGTVVWGRKIRQAIPVYLDYEEFTWHILTHSHYDHLGGTPEIYEAFRDLQIGAHPRVKRVLKSPRALEHITRMNQKELLAWGRPKAQVERYRFRPFPIHRELTEGNLIHLGDDVKIEVLETPGHTRDSLTFVIQPGGIAVVGEAAGVPNWKGDFILPQFLADYQMYLDSLQKLMARKDLEVLALPHERIVFGRKEVQEYLKRSYETTLEYARDIAAALRKHNGDLKAAEDEIFEQYYGPKELRQPEFAFRANLQAQVRAIARHLGIAPA